MSLLCWHFLVDTGLLRDGRTPPPDGEWLEHEGEIVPCKSGLHASVRAIDALQYAPGAIVCRVELEVDVVEHGGDKHVGRRRRILWRADATDVLRLFMRRQALSVLHLWDAPDVVREFLVTGNESLRAAAWDAASAAARAAARDAASAAARDAAWDAARAAAWAAASAAAWAAASAAESAAAGAAAWAAAWAAASAAASAAESAATGAAAWAAANDMLTEMLMGLGPKEVAR